MLVAALMLGAALVQGGMLLQKSWLWSGDMIYHRALMAEILNGELLPGGPYAGLPAFYSPLFHYLSAAIAWVAGIDPLEAVKTLSVLAAAATPLAAYRATRLLGLKPGVALLAAFFATFGGGLKQDADRVWVDALFVGQHNFFPFFPRDGAFLLLPLALAWLYRSTIARERRTAFLAGVAFGLMVLVHAQTAIFGALVGAMYLVGISLWQPAFGTHGLRIAGMVAGVGLAISAIWWVPMVDALMRSGSFQVHMPESRVPVTIRLLELPLEFGVFLPLGLLGVARTIRRMRQGNRAAWLLLIWWSLPVAIALLRPSGFPGGDTFFPRRLWQFASQPLMVMAADALLTDVLPRLRWRALALLCTLVLASVPACWGSWQRLAEFWNQPSFARTDWDLAGNFRYATWLAAAGRREGPSTVLAPLPDATLVWYFAGQKVVYLYPTPAIKLAFDVKRLTGFSQLERQADFLTAYRGNPADVTAIADRYAAAYVVLHRRGDTVAAVDLPAAGLRADAKGPDLVQSNQFEYLRLGKDDSTRFQFFSPRDGLATVALRMNRRSAAPEVAAWLDINGSRFAISERDADRDRYQDVTLTVPLRAGLNDARFTANAEIELARFQAYTMALAEYRAPFTVAYADPYTVVLARR